MVQATRNTHSTVTSTNGTVTLTGYLMTDDTFDFIIGGKMHNFKTLLDVWAAWDNINSDNGTF